MTLIVLIVAAAAIALANLSSEPVTIELLGETVLKGKPAERSFGWPINWYWCKAKVVQRKTPGTFFIGTGTIGRLQWPISKLDFTRLIVNVAAWLGILAVSWIACKRLPRRMRLQTPLRPRIATVLLLLIVSAAITLANLSFDASTSPHQHPPYVASFGWPWIWYWHCLGGALHWTDYSAPRLAANLALWVLILSAIGFACERLLRRHRPRLRWSLRTMLGAVGLAAALCGWYAAARRRADEEGPLIAEIEASYGQVYVERWGPKWLDILGADALRRYIVGAELVDEEQDLEQVRKLRRLPRLEHLAIGIGEEGMTAAVAAELGEMRELRTLEIVGNSYGGERDDAVIVRELLAAASRLTRLEHFSLWTGAQILGDDIARLADAPNLKSLTLKFSLDGETVHAVLPAVGKLTQIERLYLEGTQLSRAELAQLGALTNLKSLTLECLGQWDADESEMGEGEPGMLEQFPILPRLESLDLFNGFITDRDLRRLARFPRLRGLGLEGTRVTDAGLAELAPLESLEELAIGEDMATVGGLESLAALKRLRAVHVYFDPGKNVTPTPGTGDIQIQFSGDADALARALEALRQSHPGIVIDADYDGFQEKFQLGTGEPQWDPEQAPDRGSIHALLRRYVEEQ